MRPSERRGRFRGLCKCHDDEGLLAGHLVAAFWAVDPARCTPVVFLPSCCLMKRSPLPSYNFLLSSSSRYLARNRINPYIVGVVPGDLLSAEDVSNREKLINLRSVSKRKLHRLPQNGFLLHKILSKRNRRRYPMPNNFERPSRPLRKARHRRSLPAIRSANVSTKAVTTVADTAHSGVPKNSPSVMAATTTTEATSARGEVRTELPKATATVHRLAIRSNTIVVEHGLVRARLRYLIQLHQAIQGVHKLVFEIRINPEFRPVYVG
ncbi:unnamed protein product [Schistocephalus solidus]|uniref:DUF5739 domain-containing protein n=1 Tax=Schistocephalus solidus TaxID=70667 RepID=A0A183SPT7_SCHSO|nr:unnamed protein product [Schistocephalus solidus]